MYDAHMKCMQYVPFKRAKEKRREREIKCVYGDETKRNEMKNEMRKYLKIYKTTRATYITKSSWFPKHNVT